MVIDLVDAAGATRDKFGAATSDTGGDGDMAGTTVVPTNVCNALMKNRSAFKMNFKKLNGGDEQAWFRFKKNLIS